MNLQSGLSSQRVKPSISGLLKSGIRGLLYNFLSRKMVESIQGFRALLVNYKYDRNRYLKWSSVSKKNPTYTQLKALITMDYHRIEKGLALRETKVGFGREVIERLIQNIDSFQKKYGDDDVICVSLNALLEYHRFSKANGINNQHLHEEISRLKSNAHRYDEISSGGTVSVTKEEILRTGKIDLHSFFQNRYSIRQFSSQEVVISLIEQAIRMAQKTPSVCNRQASKVYVLSDFEDKQKALSYQNGNRGFGEQASKVLIVVSDLEHFTSLGERNQCWIDGGMFAMSLVYALHSLGLGSCCLNWSVEHYTDKAFRQAIGIPDSEAVIMLIAVGHLPERLNVTQSPRKQLSEVLIFK